MSELACNIVLYRPDPDMLAARYRYWHVEALLSQADALINRCLQDYGEYCHLDFTWHELQTDLEAQEKKLGVYNQTAAKDVFVREMFQGPDLTALEKNLERNPYYPLLKLKEQGFRPIDVNAAELPTAAAPAVEATCSYQPTWRMGGGIYVRRHVDAVANEVDQQMAKFAAAEREVEQQKQ